MYLFVGGASEPQSIRKQDRSAVKEQVTGKTTWGIGILESKRKLIDGLQGCLEVAPGLCALVKRWAKAEFRATHHLALGLGQVLGMLQTVKGQSYIYIKPPQMLVVTNGMHGVVWPDAFPPPVCHTLPHPSAKVDRSIIQSISKFALYLHVWVNYMHVLFLNK